MSSAEGFPGPNPDFSSLAELANKTPEIKRDDDDDDEASEKENTKPAFEFGKNNPEKLKDDKSEKKDQAEKEIPLEKLAEDEKLLIVEAREEEVNDELIAAPPDSVNEKEALVAATFLKVLAEKVRQGETFEQALDPAAEDALDIAGIETDDTEDQSAEDEPSEVTIEITKETSVEDNLAEEQEDPVADPASSTPPGSPPPPPSPPHGSSSAPGSNPNGPSSTRPPSPPTGFGGPGNFGPNSLSSPNIAPTSTIDSDYINVRRSNRRHLLVGGIVGYAIGRRRGRIKTENKLLPIQHELEKEVTDLQKQLRLREEKIRSIVRNQVAQKPEMQERIVERMQVLQEMKNIKPEKTPEQQALPKRPEKLGMFAMGAERPLVEKSIKLEPERFKDFSRMTTRELLEIAGKISVEQSSVKRLFETGRLDDEGLRRVVLSYLSGEHYERVIRDNLKTTEKYAFPETLQNNTAAMPTVSDSSLNAPSDFIAQSAGHQSTKSSAPNPAHPAQPPKTQDQVPANGKQKATYAGLAVAAVVAAAAAVIYMIAG